MHSKLYALYVYDVCETSIFVHSRWFEGQGLHVHLEQRLGLANRMLATVVRNQEPIVHGFQAMVDRRLTPLARKERALQRNPPG